METDLQGDNFENNTVLIPKNIEFHYHSAFPFVDAWADSEQLPGSNRQQADEEGKQNTHKNMCFACKK